MPEGDTIHRSASALRTALGGKPMLRFDAPRLVGLTPQPGRVVERVESHGKHIEIVWDDNLMLHTHNARDIIASRHRPITAASRMRDLVEESELLLPELRCDLRLEYGRTLAACDKPKEARALMAKAEFEPSISPEAKTVSA